VELNLISTISSHNACRLGLGRLFKKGERRGQKLQLCRGLKTNFINQRTNGLGGLSALANPVVDSLKVKAQSNRVQGRVVVSHHFNKVPVSRAAPFRHHNTVMRIFLGPMPS